MRRREFISLGTASLLLGGCTGFVPAARAQQPVGRKRVGLLWPAGNRDGSVPLATQASINAVRAGLKEEGFVDGANVSLDNRFGLNDPGLIRTVAHDLAASGYDVLMAMGSTPATAALLAETRTTPIVFAGPSDPVGSGFVQSFARPGGNVTGFTNYEPSQGGKWLEMLHEVAPGVRRAVMMFNPDTGLASFFVPSFRAAAAALGIEPAVAEVRTLVEIESAFADLARTPGAGVVMGPENYVRSDPARRTFIDAVARQNLPAVYTGQPEVEAGGLIGYGIDFPDLYRRSGGYVGLILKGARPADLPVQAPTKFVLSVNLKTARAQGITIPPGLLVLADEVVQ